MPVVAQPRVYLPRPTYICAGVTDKHIRHELPRPGRGTRPHRKGMKGKPPPPAPIPPPCTAAELARVMSGVSFETSNYLANDPAVNDFFTNLKGQPKDQLGWHRDDPRGGSGRSAGAMCADSTQRLWVHDSIQVVVGKAASEMARKKGSRWDVGTKDKAISLERFDDDDERVSEDVLEVGEARELAALLTKHADKLDESDGDDSKDGDDSDEDDSDEDDSTDEDKDDSTDKSSN